MKQRRLARRICACSLTLRSRKLLRAAVGGEIDVELHLHVTAAIEMQNANLDIDSCKVDRQVAVGMCRCVLRTCLESRKS